jgi:hypothetical protein
MKGSTIAELMKFLEPTQDIAIRQIVSGFLNESEAAVDLAKKCEFHPALHSLVNLNSLRAQFQTKLGLDPNLYAPGKKTSGYTIDSAFDEVIDDVVEGIAACTRK